MFSIAMAIMICGVNMGKGSTSWTPKGAGAKMAAAIVCDFWYLAVILLFIALR